MTNYKTYGIPHLIEKYTSKSLACEIFKASIKYNSRYGTICMPTGYGKTSHMAEDMILSSESYLENVDLFSMYNQLTSTCEHITGTMSDINFIGKNLVFLINSPILILNNQLYKNIIETMLSTVLKNKKVPVDDIGIYVNSSANKNEYNQTADYINTISTGKKTIKVQSLDEIDDKAGFYKKINIVVSCNKSLYKFYSKMNRLKKNNVLGKVYVTAYLDEAHTLTIDPDSPFGSNSNENVESSRPNINSLLKVCDRLYAFSATPDNGITEKINNYAIKHGATINKQDYLVLVTPLQAINEGAILPVNVMVLSYKKNNNPDKNKITITWQVCKDVLKYAKEDNPNIEHRILVSCTDKDELRNLMNKLIENCDGTYDVFSTCSEYGFRTMADGEIKDGDKPNKSQNVGLMKKKIKECKKDCFVLHIRRLICGIDIDSLTDCIIKTNFGDSSDNHQNYDYYVQVIGRVLRPLAGERGKDKIDARKKKHGNVFFLNPDGCKGGESEDQNDKILEFVYSIYGCDNITSVFGSKRTSLVTNSGEDGKNPKDTNKHMQEYYISPVFKNIQLEFGKAIKNIISANILDMFGKSKDWFLKFIKTELSGYDIVISNNIDNSIYGYKLSDHNIFETNILDKIINNAYEKYNI